MTKTREIVEYSVELDASKELGLPRALLTFAVSVRAPRPRVQAAYLAIPERGEEAARTESFDDGRVAVDFDEDGLVRGVEFLAQKGSEELPEYVDAGKRSHETRLLYCAASTILRWWEHLEFEFDVISHVARKEVQPAIFPKAIRAAMAKRHPRWERQGQFAGA